MLHVEYFTPVKMNGIIGMASSSQRSNKIN